MAVFPWGFVWPDAAGTPTALTTTFVPSTVEFQVESQSRLFLMPTVGNGADDPGLELMVDVTFPGHLTPLGTAWFTGFKLLAVPALFANTVHGIFLDLPAQWHRSSWRISARNMRGDPNTLVNIYAESLPRGLDGIYEGIDDRPIDLANACTEGIDAFSDGAGGPLALGAAFALGPPAPAPAWWVPVGRATECEIWCTTTGGPPTSIEMLVEETLDDGGEIATLPAVNTVASGVVNCFPAQEQIQSAAGTLANGTYVTRRFSVKPGSWIRMQAKRTGAAVNLLAKFKLFRY